MQPVAYFFFEHSTKSAQPWADAGYLCYCVDIQHPAGEHQTGNIIKVGADMLTYQPEHPAAFACAFPPCTHLTISGAQHWKGKGLRLLAQSIELVAIASDLCEALTCPYFIENPVGALSSHWRKPDYMFDPCDFAGYLEPAERAAEAYTKRTCLWIGGGFQMPVRKEVLALLGSKMHFIAPGPHRANLRSETPRGFAQAVFEANNALIPATI